MPLLPTRGDEVDDEPMGTKAELVSGMPDLAKWVLGAVVLAAGLGGFYYFRDQSLLFRVIGVLVAAGMSIAIGASLIAPIAMEEGLRFAIREGGRTVGAGVVARILE